MYKDYIEQIHEGIYSTYQNSEIVVLGAPFDGTTSYRPGTRFGPQAIRQELDGLETYSPYQDKDMADYSFCDLGDIPLSFGNTEKILTTIGSEVADIIKDEKRVVMLGGEHLVSYPAIKAHLEKYPEMHIIHFDAHADLRSDYLGEELSHATVIRRAFDHMAGGKVWQFGIRSGTKEEFEFAKEYTQMCRFDLSMLDNAIKEIGDAPVYITIDLDILDPSIFSGTGTPEPGGVTFKELVDGITKLQNLNIVGSDIVELSPHYDQSGVSTAVACKVLREMLLVMV
jgi:agmatinase